MRPNVLLVVLDAARRDALEPYGAPAGASPAMAQLARRGTALDDVYATACWTVPSHSSIFTGLMPRAAGLAQVRSPAEAQPRVRSLADRVLPAVLGRAGYRTLGASANLWVSPRTGYDTGFERFEEVDSGRHARLHGMGRRERLRWLAEGVRGHADDGGRAVERILHEWLGASDRPFFCFVNLLECHSPYLPPRPYGPRSPLDRLKAAEDARRYSTLDQIWRVNSGAASVPAAALERSRRMYAGAIRFMDDWMGRVLERLDETGLLDETLVIVISDHGENFGENGLIAHGLSLDNRLIHVPFVAAGPGSDGTLNSLASLPRYIAEAVGLQDHPYEDEPPPGVGVAQFDPPASADDEEVVGAIRDAGLEHVLHKFTTPMTCAVANGLKLLYRGDREEVYDLGRDPFETAPVAAHTVPAEALGRLRSALDHPAMTARRAPDTAPAAPPAASEEEMRELEDRMKLLGYM